jgi:zinc transport system ATP-binding protein
MATFDRSERMHDAVSITSVSYAYPDAPSPALEEVSLVVRSGERLGILGPNGGGKSTLLRLILGLLELQSGDIRVCGRTPAQARREGLIGYVPQRPEIELSMPLSAREVVELGAAWRLSPMRRVPASVRLLVEETLSLVGASEFADKPIGSLSGGQLQRVLIGRALVSRPRILALDEPMVGIDAAGQRQFASLLASIHARTGVTMLTVTHDLRAIVAGSDQVACLARRLHSHGSPTGLTPAVLAELFSHDVAGLMGELAGVHVHAHGAGEACPQSKPASCCDHHHGHGEKHA